MEGRYDASGRKVAMRAREVRLGDKAIGRGELCLKDHTAASCRIYLWLTTVCANDFASTTVASGIFTGLHFPSTIGYVYAIIAGCFQGYNFESKRGIIPVRFRVPHPCRIADPSPWRYYHTTSATATILLLPASGQRASNMASLNPQPHISHVDPLRYPGGCRMRAPSRAGPRLLCSVCSTFVPWLRFCPG